MRVCMLIFRHLMLLRQRKAARWWLRKMAPSTLHMLGAANKYGWYQVGYDETDVWYGTVIDFAEAEEREISAPDSLPMNGRVGNLQVDDAQIVWSWSGMLTDTPALVVTDFDRNQTGGGQLPAGWSPCRLGTHSRRRTVLICQRPVWSPMIPPAWTSAACFG